MSFLSANFCDLHLQFYQAMLQTIFLSWNFLQRIHCYKITANLPFIWLAVSSFKVIFLFFSVYAEILLRLLRYIPDSWLGKKSKCFRIGGTILYNYFCLRTTQYIYLIPRSLHSAVVEKLQSRQGTYTDYSIHLHDFLVETMLVLAILSKNKYVVITMSTKYQNFLKLWFHHHFQRNLSI